MRCEGFSTQEILAMRFPFSLAFAFALFAISGFAGLIYQSIWSQYLKLMLGHAAYAQTMVLMTFMGGMAAGSWLVSRKSQRISNPLLIYAAVEFAVGVLALVFHTVFVSTQGFLHDTLLPNIASPLIAEGAKWILGVVILLPQAVLIGSTFPLMSAAISRAFPEAPGYVLSGLYFSNSFGAAVGVLASGFVLIKLVGLPGTLVTAGLVNLGLAIVLWRLSKLIHLKPGGEADSKSPGNSESHLQEPDSFPTRLAAALALATGAATFVYEIAWTRMLSLVLGGSTHSFELMLSAMILGIATGSLWIRRRIDKYRSLLPVLSIAIALKGATAIATMPVYAQTFDWMQSLQLALSKTDFAYSLMNVAGHAFSMMVMFPAAFFSGMSLPILTTWLLRRGEGERAIGQVYAWNTLGAIIGVMFAVHIGMTHLGLKNLLLAGSAVDIGVAIWIVLHGNIHVRQLVATVNVLLVVALFGVVGAFVQFDTLKLASGVFRGGQLYSPESARVVFYRDGKTATISVTDHANGIRGIATNGKTDASLHMDSETPHAATDESTMVLLGALPLAYRPNAKIAANIGFGSGQTTHTLLAHPSLALVDSIEIEPVMVEGAKLFGPLVERAFQDPRSRIHYDDAKSYFAASRTKYDIIVSEPSNPWISGVAGLFSDEFYARIRGSLRDDGVFVQWVQLYETDLKVVSSIMRAVNKNFRDYAIFDVKGSEMLVIATNSSQPLVMSSDMFSSLAMAAQLRRIGIDGLSDLESWRIGSKQSMGALFESNGAPVNSDYFPYVDQHAAQARFASTRAMKFAELIADKVPAIDIHEARKMTQSREYLRGRISRQGSMRQADQHIAHRVLDYLHGDTFVAGQANLPIWQQRVEFVKQNLGNCLRRQNDPTLAAAYFEIGSLLSKALTPEDGERTWKDWQKTRCPNLGVDLYSLWTDLFRAVNLRDSSGIAVHGAELWKMRNNLSADQRQYLSEVLMLANLRLGKRDVSGSIFQDYVGGNPNEAKVTLAHRLVLANMALPAFR